MFQPLQLEVMERFATLREHFRATRRFHGNASLESKGLVFIQAYAIWEYTVKDAVAVAGRLISQQGHAFNALRPCLQSLFLYTDLQSMKNGGDKKIWEKAMGILNRVSSASPAVLPTHIPIPSDGTHYRQTHLQLILQVFGITRKPTRRQAHLIRIDEVVQHRNHIAHGSATAASVGSRYSRKDIFKVVRQMESVCLHLIKLLSNHCAAPSRHCR